MSGTLPLPAIASPIARALGAQVGGLAAAIAFAAVITQVAGEAPAGWLWLAVQAIAAALLAWRLRLEWWWWAFSFAFGPALAAGLAAPIPTGAWGVLLGLLLLAYGGTQRTRVPLYLSSSCATAALVALLPAGRDIRVLDLGCGTGTILAALARARPLASGEGVERAPLPWLVAKLRSLASGGRFRVAWGDLWDADLAGHDVVYAYLSPAPMAQLWAKARREMKPGSLLVSFRFGIPGVAPQFEVDTGAGCLYAWRI